MNKGRLLKRLKFAEKALKEFCNSSRQKEQDLDSILYHSSNAHQQIHGAFHNLMALFDHESKAHKTGFYARRIGKESFDEYKNSILKRSGTRHRKIYEYLFDRHYSENDECLTYICEMRNQDFHNSLIGEAEINDHGWVIGNKRVVCAYFRQGSSVRVIGSDFDFRSSGDRNDEPVIPDRNQSVENGCLLTCRQKVHKCLSEIRWIPLPIVDVSATMNFYGSGLHDFRNGGMYISEKSEFKAIDVKIKSGKYEYHGDIHVTNGRMHLNLYNSTFRESINKLITEVVDKRVWVEIDGQKIDVMGYLIKSFVACYDVIDNLEDIIK